MNYADKDILVVVFFFCRVLRSAVVPSCIYVRNITNFIVKNNKILNKQSLIHAYLCYEGHVCTISQTMILVRAVSGVTAALYTTSTNQKRKCFYSLISLILQFCFTLPIYVQAMFSLFVRIAKWIDQEDNI